MRHFTVPTQQTEFSFFLFLYLLSPYSTRLYAPYVQFFGLTGLLIDMLCFKLLLNKNLKHNMVYYNMSISPVRNL